MSLDLDLRFIWAHKKDRAVLEAVPYTLLSQEGKWNNKNTLILLKTNIQYLNHSFVSLLPLQISFSASVVSEVGYLVCPFSVP